MRYRFVIARIQPSPNGTGGNLFLMIHLTGNLMTISRVRHRMPVPVRHQHEFALSVNSLDIGMSLPVRDREVCRRCASAPDTRLVLISFPDMLLSTFPCPHRLGFGHASLDQKANRSLCIYLQRVDIIVQWEVPPLNWRARFVSMLFCYTAS